MNPVNLFFYSLRKALKHKYKYNGFHQADLNETCLMPVDFSPLKKAVRKYWRLALTAVVLTFGAGLLTYPAPLIYRFLIDKVILAKDIERLPIALLLLLAVRLFLMLFNMAMNYISSLFNRKALLHLREDLTDRMLSLPQSFFDRNSPGYIMTRVNADLGGISWLLSPSPLRIIENFIKLIGGLGLLFYLEWRAGLAVVISLPLFVYLSFFFSRKQYALSNHQNEEYARSGGSMEESISNINTVKAIAGEKNFGERIMSHYHKLFHLELEQHTLNSVFQFAVSIFPQAAAFLLLVFGGIWIINGEWSLGSLLAAQAYLAFVFSPLRSLSQANIQFQRSLAALKRLNQFYAITPEYKPGGQNVNKLKGDIAFNDVSFGYSSEKGSEVLRSVSFSVEAGQKIAICGESGCGKSTLVSLLMRFYTPQKGQVIFDGDDVKAYDLKQLRRRMAYVSQEPELFTATIAENIRLNAPEVSDEQISELLAAAGLKKMVAGRKDGINSMLEDKGANLSIGQKKRLILARAIASAPDIIILDEPTAELDNETGRNLLANLKAITTGKTTFIITHDPLVASFCDKSLFILDGKIEGFDSHSALAEKCPAYRELFQLERSIDE